MRALAIDHRPEVGQLHNSLTMTEMASPEPRRGEVRIRVQATAINVDDQHFAEGTMFGGFPVAPKPSATRPWVPGTEFTGLVDQLGEGVTSLELGQPVYGMRPPKLAGPWAEYCVTKVNLVSPVPEGWPIDQAAALCLSGAVICSMLAPLGSLKDQHCLVVGASGSLGTVLVQVLSKSGARVWGVCSGVNRELVTGLGVQRVIDYKEGRFGEQLTREDISVDATLDLVGGLETEHDAMAVTRKQGNFVTVVGPELHVGERKLSPFQLSGMIARILWRWFSSRLTGPRYTFTGPLAANFAQIEQRIIAPGVRPVIDRVVDFEEASVRTAVAYVASHRARGKVVIKM